MKKYIVFMLFLAISTLFWGCATSKDVQNVERQTATINAALREIKGNLDDINFSLQAGDKRSRDALEKTSAIEKEQARLSASMKGLSEDFSVVKQNQADLGSRMFSSKGGGEISSGQVDELRHEIVNINAKMDALKAALLMRLDEMEKAARESAAATTAAQNKEPAAGAGNGNKEAGKKEAGGQATAATATPPGDPSQMYQAAYLDYTKGNYDLAVQGFREFLKAFPDAEFSGNAQYWVGESLYSLGKYEDALAEFDKVIANYPASNKVPGAMLKEGFCYDALKRPKEAKEAYQSLMKKYPDSEAAKLAGDRLKKK
jgi:tol-pal system protein YbgF